MKVAVSYSGGKESALSLYRVLQQGHEVVALITTYNAEAGRSFFHGLTDEVLERVSDALKIPMIVVKTGEKSYTEDFGVGLKQAKEMGAQACVFGDIDVEGHRDWWTRHCDIQGMEAVFPLWGEKREDVAREIIDSGIVATLTVVNTKQLGERFLGKRFSKGLAEEIVATGSDICGENGEYHTFVSDGPMFKHPVEFKLGEPVQVREDFMAREVR
ncbi:MAG: diphthine--ammonia ligase [Defluviitaleaceae bacterium]|nr:diphthine--ammonia ligase [Defluviitaleaceae bacterium]